MRNFLTLLILPFLVLSADARERIYHYDSAIDVQTNGDLIITETIEVQANGQQIKRGIYRDFPTDYKDRTNNRVIVDFEVLSVLRDGKAEAYHLERRENGQRVYVGRKDHPLSPGRYTYTLTYRTNFQIGFFDDHDELYFNAIGHGWVFPIEKATATIRLPASVNSADIRTEGYSGPEGAKGQDFHMAVEGNTATYTMTKSLRRHEGLTVVVMWPKGHIQEPTDKERFHRMLRHNKVVWITGLGCLITGLYYFLAWMAVGKDPDKGVIIPEYEPPLNLSPAAARYVMKMGYDNRCFACALINLAVKGSVDLKESKTAYSIHMKNGLRPDASRGEKKIFNLLIGGHGSITLKQSNHSKIGRSVKALKTALAAEYNGTCFRKNSAYLIPGFLLSILTIVAAFLLAGKPDALFLGVWLSIWSVGVFAMGRQLVNAWRAPKKGVANTVGALGITAFAVPFVGAEIFVFFMLAKMIPLAAVILLVVLVAINLRFVHLIKQPTVMGRELMDLLEGFKLYLSVAEDESLAAMKGPAKTPELFEAYLPYALALDVEQEWSEQFAAILANAGQETGDGGYRPLWHHSSHRQFDSSAFAGALGGALASAIASSSTAPGSSSGGGGGGSSGGGGGGGGGGGW